MLIKINYFRLSIALVYSLSGIFFGCSDPVSTNEAALGFYLTQDDSDGSISVYRTGSTDPVLVQNAKEEMRPYLHPIMAPDGNGSLTEYSPGHHTHQTGFVLGIYQG